MTDCPLSPYLSIALSILRGIYLLTEIERTLEQMLVRRRYARANCGTLSRYSRDKDRRSWPCRVSRESQFHAAADVTHAMHMRSTVRRQYSDRT